MFLFRIDDHFDFNVLVKTDDDCYLNVPSILKVINTSQLLKFMYWISYVMELEVRV